MEGFIGGTRNFMYQEKIVSDEKPKRLSPLQRRILRVIPYYPQEISVSDLAAKLGFPSDAMYTRLASCSFHGLIAEDEGRVTRLRRDLSNVG
jgi:DNA-binding MarR family transcriptional regulator